MDLRLGEDDFWERTPREFVLMHERHVELLVEREKRERLRLGHAVSLLMMAQGAKRKDGKELTAFDVFPEPREDVEERAEHEKQVRIYNMFRGMMKAVEA